MTESPPLSANCRECGWTFWEGTLDKADDLIALTNQRKGYYCKLHSQEKKK
jgi:hypothetical protein